jgi:HAMP domain-containing protein
MLKIVRSSILTKISFLIIAVVLVTAAVVGWIFYRDSNEILVSREFEQLEGRVHLMSIRANDGVEQLREDVNIYSQTGIFNRLKKTDKSIAEDDIQGLSSVANRYFGVNRHYLLICLGPKDKNDDYECFKPQAERSVRVGLNSIFPSEIVAKLSEDYGDEYLSDVFLLREDGRVHERKIPVVLSAIYSRSANLNVFFVKDLRSNLTNALALLHPSESLYLFTRDGFFIHHPESLHVFGHDLGSKFRIQDEFPKLSWSDFFQDKKGIRTQVKRESADMLVHFDRFDQRFSRSPYFGIGAITPRERAIQGPDIVHFRSFGLTIVVIMLTAICGGLFSHYLTKHLNEITEFARRYAAGETDVQLHVTTKDEIGVLARAFQSMIAQVNERTQILRQSERETREAKIQAEETLKEKT